MGHNNGWSAASVTLGSRDEVLEDTEVERRMGFARQVAAQAWCFPETANKVMDTDLAEAFARLLVREMYQPRLGCATTRELLNEISARSNLDYKTITDR